MNKWFAATAIVFGAALSACGGAENDARPAASTGSDRQSPYREGEHYERIETPIPAQANEVVEVFSYACPACAQFQPEIDAWKRERGNGIDLSYVPAEFNPQWVMFARAFHTAQEMGALGRVHRVIFDGIYRQRRPANTLEEVADIVATAGIDRARFLQVATSPEVEAAMARSRDYVQKAGAGSTPTLIVSGKYRVSRRQVGGVTPMQVADWLIENAP